MKILIDADGCPVVDEAIHLAQQHGTEVIILCDTSHVFERDDARTITVSKGADSVDFVLVNMVQKGDLVITQDYGLAAMCLAKGAVPLSQNGMVYTNDNIDSLLLARHTAKKIRNAGGRLKGSTKRTREQDEAFVTALSALLSSKRS
ncbi:YaiI/YqxD family protein [Hydrogenoanaerobacterium sp.]|uniref:YaiI/YqxD family protein n=1 Tax=Hydrogenoanaerobacterium sp. TaxID=2953763 RepID=UPI00289A0B15|nr:YaiI/YqxD family protein [Hydrogenoanaerobacterium sp.]